MNPFSDRKWGRGMFRRADSLHTVEKCNAFVSKLHTRTYGTGNAWISHVSQDCSIFPRLEWCTLFLARLVWKKALGIGNIESYSLSLSLSTSALFVLDSRVFPLTKRKLFPSSSLFSHARLFRSLVILFHAAYRMRPPTFLLELGSFYREGGGEEEGIETNDLEGNFHFTNDSKRSLIMKVIMRSRRRWRNEKETMNERIQFIFTWKIETKYLVFPSTNTSNTRG